MIGYLVCAVVTIIISMFITAHALPAMKRFVRGWVWLYSLPAPEEKRKGRREEADSHIFEFEQYRRKAGDGSADIAVGLFEICAKGMPIDIVWSARFIPESIADKVAGWSDNLRHLRVPAAMVAGVAILGLMNYSLSRSPSHQTIGTWVTANVVIVTFTLLLSNLKHPLARRILSAWMGIGVGVMMGVILWLSIHLHLYTIPWFQVFSFGILPMVPFMQVVDKPWRDNITSGRRLLFVMCWGLAIAASLAGSQIIAGSMMPMFSLWEELVLFAGVMFVVYGAIAFAAYLLCLLGIRGSAGGLRLVAAAIRRVR